MKFFLKKLSKNVATCLTLTERRLNNEAPPNDGSKSKSKKQKSLSKTMRSYFYGIVGNYVCLYYHDLYRGSDIPRDILTKNNISEDAFVETDDFYKLGFNVDIKMEAKTIKARYARWLQAFLQDKVHEVGILRSNP